MTTTCKDLEIPGRVLFTEGQGDLLMLEINTAWGRAELYPHGAHLAHFQLKDQPPLLFMSQFSRFAEGAPIRGGIPVIFPWFGPREGEPAHGFARTQVWDLREISPLPDGAVNLRLRLPDSPAAALFPKCTVEYLLTIGPTVTAELIVTNDSEDQLFSFENCLHAYFHIGDIAAVSVTGLKGAEYLDKVDGFARKTERAEHLKIAQETDRIYVNTPHPVEIHDSKLQRRIRIEKSGSLSTVVWNPWTDRSQQMPDFGNDEYQAMLCVEPGNVGENKITLPAGKSASLKITISTLPL
jgi:D-hexose-6-phosphate mutarotase